eukprot:TRINITY_DN5966_c1_g8_i1.p1 TRINITY_DN5966_c1_g8~~TRINITY_DN5966_c1_g8_i1.p1  ORF type:complete len:544 (+),score=106.76 TRINITY_DN5966_c1_g8_i1:28-1632(+)
MAVSSNVLLLSRVAVAPQGSASSSAIRSSPLQPRRCLGSADLPGSWHQQCLLLRVPAVAALAVGAGCFAGRHRSQRSSSSSNRGMQVLLCIGEDHEDSGGASSSSSSSGSSGGSSSSSSRSSSSDAGRGDSRSSSRLPEDQRLPSTQSYTSELDALAPSPDEMVNADVPNHNLQIYRQRPTKTLTGGPNHTWGRSKISKQKVEWRLKQGPPLAHKNWNWPSKLRITAGTAKRRRLEQPPFTIRPTMEKVREALFDQVTTMHLWEDRSVRVLDLFSGTGSVGIEALSRGATECVFVDSAKECVDCTIANAWLAGFMPHEEAAKGAMNERSLAETAPLMMVGGARARVQIEVHKAQVARQPVGAITADVMDLLKDPAKYGLVNRSFNLITVSPPFGEISYRQLCTALAKSELLERDGLVAIEYPRELGVLPPVLCAPFEDPDDMDDIAQGVPMLHGVRNRAYGNTLLAIYCKLPTGVRGSACQPRAWEFTETMVPKTNLQRFRTLWRTPSVFTDAGERAFADPKKKKAGEVKSLKP